jgi:biopolymer transport protein ExbD
VVFLMLIFFMLAGQIRAPEALRVEPPRSAQGQADRPGALLILLDAQGRVALDGERLAADALTTQIAQRVAAWRADQQRAETAIAPKTGAAHSAGTAPIVTVKADAQVRHAQLRRLLEHLRAAGVEQVRLLSQPTAR